MDLLLYFDFFYWRSIEFEINSADRIRPKLTHQNGCGHFKPFFSEKSSKSHFSVFLYLLFVNFIMHQGMHPDQTVTDAKILNS